MHQKQETITVKQSETDGAGGGRWRKSDYLNLKKKRKRVLKKNKDLEDKLS